MGHSTDLANELEMHAHAMTIPFQLTYSVFTDLGILCLSLKGSDPTVYKVEATVATRMCMERVTQAGRVCNATLVALRELGVSRVTEYVHVTSRWMNADGQWQQDDRHVQVKKRRACPKAGPHHVHPAQESACRFTVQPILRALEQCC